MGDLGPVEHAFGIVFPVAMFALSVHLALPASRNLLMSVHRLVAAAKKVDPARFEREVQRANPLRAAFDTWRIGRLLQVDFRPFGPECVMLQAECRRWHRRIYLAIIPILVTALVMGVWTEWRRGR